MILGDAPSTEIHSEGGRSLTLGRERPLLLWDKNEAMLKKESSHQRTANELLLSSFEPLFFCKTEVFLWENVFFSEVCGGTGKLLVQV